MTICETFKGETKIMYQGKELEYNLFEPAAGPKEADSKDLNHVMDKLVRAMKKKLPTKPTSPCPA